MPLETATYISQLVAANPPATDSESQGANHLRLIKAVLQAQFPNFTAAALASTNAEIDAAVSAALAGTFDLGAGTVGAPALALAADHTTGVYSLGAGKIDIAVSGVQALEVNSTGLAVNNDLSAATLHVGGNNQTNGFVPTGATMVWWTASPPTGWAFANGQSFTTAAQPNLFAVLGYAYGGSGANFNVPDLREATPVGGDMGAGTNSRMSGSSFSVATLGAYIGEWLHTLVTGEMPSHNHTASSSSTDSGHTHNTSWQQVNLNITGGGGGNGPQPDTTYSAGHNQAPSSSNSANITTTTTVNNNGGGSAHNNLGPSVVCNWIIKL